jgi:hypothetical protein
MELHALITWRAIQRSLLAPAKVHRTWTFEPRRILAMSKPRPSPFKNWQKSSALVTLSLWQGKFSMAPASGIRKWSFMQLAGRLDRTCTSRTTCVGHCFLLAQGDAKVSDSACNWPSRTGVSMRNRFVAAKSGWLSLDPMHNLRGANLSVRGSHWACLSGLCQKYTSVR